jgi:hypothetical protein
VGAALLARNPLPSNNPRRGAPKALGPAARRLDLVHDERGADMADLPGGVSGLLVRDYKGREPIAW